MNEPGEHAEHPPVAADIPLCCMQCDYSLTGLATRRCPECGTPFDVAELRRLQNPEPQAVSVDPKSLVWVLVLRHPWRFARQFPATHDAMEAAWYSVCCYGASLGILGLACLPFGPFGMLIMPVAGACLVGAMWLCEAMLTDVLTLALRPAGVRRRRHFWRGIMHYTSGFSVLAAVWCGLAVHLYGDSDQLTALSTATVGAGGLIFLYWCAALGAMIHARTRPGLGRVIGWLSIPICAVLSIAAVWLCATAVLSQLWWPS